MANPKHKAHSIFQRLTAIFVLISFTLLNTSINPSYAFAETLPGSAPSSHASPADPIDIISAMGSLALPEELGNIQEIFVPQGNQKPEYGEQKNQEENSFSSQFSVLSSRADRLIIYIQNAHANVDSETNVGKLIEYFQEKFNLPLVLLEGGEGRLDSLFFKSFPDADVKKKLLEEYLQNGDLQGGEVASILSEDYDTQYYGIESQALYEENKRAFLEATTKEKEILDILDQEEKRLDLSVGASLVGAHESDERAGTRPAPTIVSGTIKTFLEKSKAFQKEEIGLLEYVKALVELQGLSSPKSFPPQSAGGSVSNGVLKTDPTRPSRCFGILSKAKDRLAEVGDLDSRLKHSGMTENEFRIRYPELHKILVSESNEKTFTGPEFDTAMNQLIKDFQKWAKASLIEDREQSTEDRGSKSGLRSQVSVLQRNLREINRMIQEYQTGRLDRGFLVKKIEEFVQRTAYSVQREETDKAFEPGVNAVRSTPYAVRIPDILCPTAKHAETISSIKGTKLFDELEQLEDDLRETLPQSAGEKELLYAYRDLARLRSFAKLEITHKQWRELQGQVARGKGQGLNNEGRRVSNKGQGSTLDPGPLTLDPMFETHKRFYRLALKRDEALFENALKLMKKCEGQVARDKRQGSNHDPSRQVSGREPLTHAPLLSVMVTGGFHQEGISAKLKEANVPYVLISPRINQIGTKENYLNAMQGKRSFMKYFNGSLWDALARDYATKLAQTLNPTTLTPELKRWRDRIIQNSLAEGRITEATNYTKYVDALVQALRKEYSVQRTAYGDNAVRGTQYAVRDQLDRELDSFLNTYFGKLKTDVNRKFVVFSNGLKDMWSKNDFTPQAVQNLLNQMNAVPKSNIAVSLALVNDRFDLANAIYSQAQPLEQTEIKRIAGDLIQKVRPDLLPQLRALGEIPINPQIARQYAEMKEKYPADWKKIFEEAGRLAEEERISGDVSLTDQPGRKSQTLEEDQLSQSTDTQLLPSGYLSSHAPFSADSAALTATTNNTTKASPDASLLTQVMVGENQSATNEPPNAISLSRKSELAIDRLTEGLNMGGTLSQASSDVKNNHNIISKSPYTQSLDISRVELRRIESTVDSPQSTVDNLRLKEGPLALTIGRHKASETKPDRISARGGSANALWRRSELRTEGSGGKVEFEEHVSQARTSLQEMNAVLEVLAQRNAGFKEYMRNKWNTIRYVLSFAESLLAARATDQRNLILIQDHGEAFSRLMALQNSIRNLTLPAVNDADGQLRIKQVGDVIDDIRMVLTHITNAIDHLKQVLPHPGNEMRSDALSLGPTIAEVELRDKQSQIPDEVLDASAARAELRRIESTVDSPQSTVDNLRLKEGPLALSGAPEERSRSELRGNESFLTRFSAGPFSFLITMLFQVANTLFYLHLVPVIFLSEVLTVKSAQNILQLFKSTGDSRFSNEGLITDSFAARDSILSLMHAEVKDKSPTAGSGLQARIGEELLVLKRLTNEARVARAIAEIGDAANHDRIQKYLERHFRKERLDSEGAWERIERVRQVIATLGETREPFQNGSFQERADHWMEQWLAIKVVDEEWMTIIEDFHSALAEYEPEKKDWLPDGDPLDQAISTTIARIKSLYNGYARTLKEYLLKRLAIHLQTKGELLKTIDTMTSDLREGILQEGSALDATNLNNLRMHLTSLEFRLRSLILRIENNGRAELRATEDVLASPFGPVSANNSLENVRNQAEAVLQSVKGAVNRYPRDTVAGNPCYDALKKLEESIGVFISRLTPENLSGSANARNLIVTYRIWELINPVVDSLIDASSAAYESFKALRESTSDFRDLENAKVDGAPLTEETLSALIERVIPSLKPGTGLQFIREQAALDSAWRKLGRDFWALRDVLSGRKSQTSRSELRQLENLINDAGEDYVRGKLNDLVAAGKLTIPEGEVPDVTIKNLVAREGRNPISRSFYQSVFDRSGGIIIAGAFREKFGKQDQVTLDDVFDFFLEQAEKIQFSSAVQTQKFKGQLQILKDRFYPLMLFAFTGHKRKFMDISYVYHLLGVALLTVDTLVETDLVRKTQIHPSEINLQADWVTGMLAAALYHDLIEDTKFSTFELKTFLRKVLGFSGKVLARKTLRRILDLTKENLTDGIEGIPPDVEAQLDEKINLMNYAQLRLGPKTLVVKYADVMYNLAEARVTAETVGTPETAAFRDKFENKITGGEGKFMEQAVYHLQLPGGEEWFVDLANRFIQNANQVTGQNNPPLASTTELENEAAQIKVAVEKYPSTKAQIEQIHLILQNPEEAKAMAEWLNGAYYRGIGQPEPAFEPTKENIAINLAGFYALESGIGVLSEWTGQSPLEILDQIKAGTLPEADMLLLARFANATWKASQPFRDLQRITRDTFRPAVELTPEELAKDFDQIRGAAEEFSQQIVEELKRASLARPAEIQTSRSELRQAEALNAFGGVSVDSDRRSLGQQRSEVRSKLLQYPSFQFLLRLIDNPTIKVKMAEIHIKILTVVDWLVKKLLAYAAPKVIDKILSIKRSIKSLLSSVKNIPVFSMTNSIPFISQLSIFIFIFSNIYPRAELRLEPQVPIETLGPSGSSAEGVPPVSTKIPSGAEGAPPVSAETLDASAASVKNVERTARVELRQDLASSVERGAGRESQKTLLDAERSTLSAIRRAELRGGTGEAGYQTSAHVPSDQLASLAEKVQSDPGILVSLVSIDYSRRDFLKIAGVATALAVTGLGQIPAQVFQNAPSVVKTRPPSTTQPAVSPLSPEGRLAKQAKDRLYKAIDKIKDLRARKAVKRMYDTAYAMTEVKVGASGLKIKEAHYISDQETSYVPKSKYDTLTDDEKVEAVFRSLAHELVHAYLDLLRKDSQGTRKIEGKKTSLDRKLLQMMEEDPERINEERFAVETAYWLSEGSLMLLDLKFDDEAGRLQPVTIVYGTRASGDSQGFNVRADKIVNGRNENLPDEEAIEFISQVADQPHIDPEIESLISNLLQVMSGGKKKWIPRQPSTTQPSRSELRAETDQDMRLVQEPLQNRLAGIISVVSDKSLDIKNRQDVLNALNAAMGRINPAEYAEAARQLRAVSALVSKRTGPMLILDEIDRLAESLEKIAATKSRSELRTISGEMLAVFDRTQQVEMLVLGLLGAAAAGLVVYLVKLTVMRREFGRLRVINADYEAYRKIEASQIERDERWKDQWGEVGLEELSEQDGERIERLRAEIEELNKKIDEGALDFERQYDDIRKRFDEQLELGRFFTFFGSSLKQLHRDLDGLKQILRRLKLKIDEGRSKRDEMMKVLAIEEPEDQSEESSRAELRSVNPSIRDAILAELQKKGYEAQDLRSALHDIINLLEQPAAALSSRLDVLGFIQTVLRRYEQENNLEMLKSLFEAILREARVEKENEGNDRFLELTEQYKALKTKWREHPPSIEEAWEALDKIRRELVAYQLLGTDFGKALEREIKRLEQLQSKRYLRSLARHDKALYEKYRPVIDGVLAIVLLGQVPAAAIQALDSFEDELLPPGERAREIDMSLISEAERLKAEFLKIPGFASNNFELLGALRTHISRAFFARSELRRSGVPTETILVHLDTTFSPAKEEILAGVREFAAGLEKVFGVRLSAYNKHHPELPVTQLSRLNSPFFEQWLHKEDKRNGLLALEVLIENMDSLRETGFSEKVFSELSDLLVGISSSPAMLLEDLKAEYPKPEPRLSPVVRVALAGTAFAVIAVIVGVILFLSLPAGGGNFVPAQPAVQKPFDEGYKSAVRAAMSEPDYALKVSALAKSWMENENVKNPDQDYALIDWIVALGQIVNEYQKDIVLEEGLLQEFMSSVRQSTGWDLLFHPDGSRLIKVEFTQRTADDPEDVLAHFLVESEAEAPSVYQIQTRDFETGEIVTVKINRGRVVRGVITSNGVRFEEGVESSRLVRIAGVEIFSPSVKIKSVRLVLRENGRKALATLTSLGEFLNRKTPIVPKSEAKPVSTSSTSRSELRQERLNGLIRAGSPLTVGKVPYFVRYVAEVLTGYQVAGWMYQLSGEPAAGLLAGVVAIFMTWRVLFRMSSPRDGAVSVQVGRALMDGAKTPVSAEVVRRAGSFVRSELRSAVAAVGGVVRSSQVSGPLQGVASLVPVAEKLIPLGPGIGITRAPSPVSLISASRIQEKMARVMSEKLKAITSDEPSAKLADPEKAAMRLLSSGQTFAFWRRNGFSKQAAKDESPDQSETFVERLERVEQSLHIDDLSSNISHTPTFREPIQRAELRQNWSGSVNNLESSSPSLVQSEPNSASLPPIAASVAQPPASMSELRSATEVAEPLDETAEQKTAQAARLFAGVTWKSKPELSAPDMKLTPEKVRKMAEWCLDRAVNLKVESAMLNVENFLPEVDGVSHEIAAFVGHALLNFGYPIHSKHGETQAEALERAGDFLMEVADKMEQSFEQVGSLTMAAKSELRSAKDVLELQGSMARIVGDAMETFVSPGEAQTYLELIQTMAFWEEQFRMRSGDGNIALEALERAEQWADRYGATDNPWQRLENIWTALSNEDLSIPIRSEMRAATGVAEPLRRIEGATPQGGFRFNKTVLGASGALILTKRLKITSRWSMPSRLLMSWHRVARRYASDTTLRLIKANGLEFDLASITNLFFTDIQRGQEVKLEASGPRAKEALRQAAIILGFSGLTDSEENAIRLGLAGAEAVSGAGLQTGKDAEPPIPGSQLGTTLTRTGDQQLGIDGRAELRGIQSEQSKLPDKLDVRVSVSGIPKFELFTIRTDQIPREAFQEAITSLTENPEDSNRLLQLILYFPSGSPVALSVSSKDTVADLWRTWMDPTRANLDRMPVETRGLDQVERIELVLSQGGDVHVSIQDAIRRVPSPKRSELRQEPASSRMMVRVFPDFRVSHAGIREFGRETKLDRNSIQFVVMEVIQALAPQLEALELGTETAVMFDEISGLELYEGLRSAFRGYTFHFQRIEEGMRPEEVGAEGLEPVRRSFPKFKFEVKRGNSVVVNGVAQIEPEPAWPARSQLRSLKPPVSDGVLDASAASTESAERTARAELRQNRLGSGRSTSEPVATKSELRTENLSALDILRKINRGRERKFKSLAAYQAATMMDAFDLNKTTRVLAVGIGDQSYPLLAAAAKGAYVDVVQPPTNDGIEQTKNLDRFIRHARAKLKLAIQQDPFGRRIDTRSYQTLIQNANLRENYYSLALLLNVLDDPQLSPQHRDIILDSLYRALASDARLLVSSLGRIDKVVGMISERFGTHGAQVTLTGRSFPYRWTRIYELQILKPGQQTLPPVGDGVETKRSELSQPLSASAAPMSELRQLSGEKLKRWVSRRISQDQWVRAKVQKMIEKYDKMTMLQAIKIMARAAEIVTAYSKDPLKRGERRGALLEIKNAEKVLDLSDLGGDPSIFVGRYYEALQAGFSLKNPNHHIVFSGDILPSLFTSDAGRPETYLQSFYLYLLICEWIIHHPYQVHPAAIGRGRALEDVLARRFGKKEAVEGWRKAALKAAVPVLGVLERALNAVIHFVRPAWKRIFGYSLDSVDFLRPLLRDRYTKRLLRRFEKTVRAMPLFITVSADDRGTRKIVFFRDHVGRDYKSRDQIVKTKIRHGDDNVARQRVPRRDWTAKFLELLGAKFAVTGHSEQEVLIKKSGEFESLVFLPGSDIAVANGNQIIFSSLVPPRLDDKIPGRGEAFLIDMKVNDKTVAESFAAAVRAIEAKGTILDAEQKAAIFGDIKEQYEKEHDLRFETALGFAEAFGVGNYESLNAAGLPELTQQHLAAGEDLPASASGIDDGTRIELNSADEIGLVGAVSLAQNLAGQRTEVLGSLPSVVMVAAVGGAARSELRQDLAFSVERGVDREDQKALLDAERSTLSAIGRAELRHKGSGRVRVESSEELRVKSEELSVQPEAKKPQLETRVNAAISIVQNAFFGTTDTEKIGEVLEAVKESGVSAEDFLDQLQNRLLETARSKKMSARSNKLQVVNALALLSEHVSVNDVEQVLTKGFGFQPDLVLDFDLKKAVKDLAQILDSTVQTIADPFLPAPALTSDELLKLGGVENRVASRLEQSIQLNTVAGIDNFIFYDPVLERKLIDYVVAVAREFSLWSEGRSVSEFLNLHFIAPNRVILDEFIKNANARLQAEKIDYAIPPTESGAHIFEFRHLEDPIYANRIASAIEGKRMDKKKPFAVYFMPFELLGGMNQDRHKTLIARSVRLTREDSLSKLQAFGAIPLLDRYFYTTSDISAETLGKFIENNAFRVEGISFENGIVISVSEFVQSLVDAARSELRQSASA